MIKAVIFDFDGVLAGTIFVSVEELRHIFAERGLKFDERKLLLLEGAKIKKIIAELLDKDMDNPLVEEIYREKVRIFRKHRLEIKPWPEAISLVKSLKSKGLLIGLASGGYRENIETILRGHIKLFDAVITGDDVHEAKPNPTVFLKAAEKLGVKPEECVVIDNAPRGVEAAKKAGMKCIGITTTLKPEDLGKADVVVSNFREAKKAIDLLRESSK